MTRPGLLTLVAVLIVAGVQPARSQGTHPSPTRRTPPKSSRSDTEALHSISTRLTRLLHSHPPRAAPPPPCSGHGTLNPDSTCSCDNPRPAAGASGWTGGLCQVPVVGLDTQTLASHEAQSGNLESATWKCYHTATPAVGDWNYLSLQLKQLDGDPDVYGMFYNASDAARYPTGNTLGWDFREVSSSSRDFVQLSVQRQRWAHTNAVGVYLCVTAYGDHVTSYELRSMFTKCPGGFTQGEGTEDANSVATVCSAVSGGAGEVPGRCDESTGECVCEAYEDHTFVKPEGSEHDDVPSELGFDSCGSRIDFVPAGSKGKTWEDVNLEADSWAFYRFEITDDDYQVLVTMERDETDGGSARLFLRHETLPDSRWGHHDLPDDFVSGTHPTQEVAVTKGDVAFVAGTWYAGVHAGTGSPSKFTVSVRKYDCPRDCSGRGECVVAQNGTRACRCDTGPLGPYLGVGCEEEYSGLTPAKDGWHVNGTLGAADYDFFMLPAVDVRESKRQIELVLSAEYTRDESSYYWRPERPVLLLLHGDDRTVFPSADNYTFKVTMETRSKEYSIQLCAAQMRGAKWQAALYNPARTVPMEYSMSFRKKGVCPSATDGECSDNGDCVADVTSPDFATCKCKTGWTAADCNFRTCPEGSFIAVPLKDPEGGHAATTCYRECVDGKHRADGCDRVSCDPPARSAADGSGCVTDECAGDLFFVDAGRDVSCVKRCVAASPGSPKRLSETCDPDTVRGARGSSGERVFRGTMAAAVIALVVVAGGLGYYAYAACGGAELVSAMKAAFTGGSGRGFRHYDRFDGETNDFGYDTP